LSNLPVGHIDFNPNVPPDPPEINKARVFALQEYIKHLRQEDLVVALCQCVSSIDDEHLTQALEQMSDEDLAQTLRSTQKETFSRDGKYSKEFEANHNICKPEEGLWNSKT
jgi:hypothetical protein